MTQTLTFVCTAKQNMEKVALKTHLNKTTNRCMAWPGLCDLTLGSRECKVLTSTSYYPTDWETAGTARRGDEPSAA